MSDIACGMRLPATLTTPTAPTDMKGSVTRVPEGDDHDHQVNVQLVVELYSR